MKKLLFIIIILIAGNAFAQDKYFYVSLDISKPLDNTNWINSTTARGGKAGVRFFINPKISAGLDLGWSTYDEYKPTKTIYTNNSAVTSDYFNYIYNYSAAISAQYNFKVGDGEVLFPYAGLGLGANTNEYVLYYNIYQDSERSWGFLARPEAGILVKFSHRRSIGAMAAIHYDYSTNKSENYNYDRFSALGFQIGLVFITL
ncbi:outer membrane beta-barrel protein [Chryseosolibacter indicus]|uniref:Outer membrane protein beta-barrel domain-containing protein n=1 Tax=Chryseosolibacter indicus TaxID=2782351 RepID=A0ABS5VYE3_9BACT|nr:outer membrane beta-barrel protein [Chryseosolibacter indicus]MBT1706437.1 hypothetical protein [Chryseosolibacter indicus]